jgi:ribosomal protein S8
VKKTTMAKNEYIGFRTSKEIKQILQELADQGYRTLSQQCEMAIIEWLKKHGYLKEKPKK